MAGAALGVWALGALALSGRRGAPELAGQPGWTSRSGAGAGAAGGGGGGRGATRPPARGLAHGEALPRRVEPRGGNGAAESERAAAQHREGGAGAVLPPAGGGGAAGGGLGEHVARAAGGSRAGPTELAGAEWLAPVGDTVRADAVRGRARGGQGGSPPDPPSSPSAASRREAVRRAMQHAWKGYEDYAWGYDELDTIGLKGRDDFSGLGATIVDSLDTLWIMGLKEEFARAADWVEHKLSFDPDYGTTSLFETNIRIVGGLLSAYYLSGDRMFLGRAQELADRLLPAFNTGQLDVTFDNDIDITTGRHQKSLGKTVAHWGTIQMEFLALSRETGDPKYWELASAPIQALWDDDPETGLLPTRYTPGWRRIVASARKGVFGPGTPPAKQKGSPSPAAFRGDKPGDHFTMGGEADSYYEYLLKTWLLSGGSSDLGHHKALYTNAVNMMDEVLVQRPDSDAGADALTYLRTVHIFNMEDANDAMRKKMMDGKRFMHLPYESSSVRGPKAEMQHLACFVPGMLVLGAPHSEQPGRDLRLAADLTETCYAMYGTATGLAGESAVFDSKTGRIKAPTKGNMFNLLRPEAVEAFFYLWRSTGEQKYRDWGWEVFQAFEKNCRMEEGGYAGLRNVSNPVPLGNHKRKMESFFLAETLKYLYLLFSPSDVLPLNEWVFNTEAHPFITSPGPQGAPLEPQPFEATQQKLWEAAAAPA